MDGAFCLSCVLFGDIFSGKTSKINRLFSAPLCRWNDAVLLLKNMLAMVQEEKWDYMLQHFQC